MSKYDTLWDYIANCSDDELTMTFSDIEKVSGVAIDHSFLRYKKELIAYGREVGKISMKEQKVVFRRIPKSETLIIYIHGKGGTAKEAEHYKALFSGCDVVGLDYKSETPWEAKEEFPPLFQTLCKGYSRVILIANSIGAYLSMCALPQENINTAYFISPIVNMEKLICDMMQ